MSVESRWATLIICEEYIIFLLLQIVLLSSISDLQGYIDKSQLTEDLGGTLEYRHSQWISHRTVSTSLCALFRVCPCFPGDRGVWDQPWGGHCLWLPNPGKVGFSKPRVGVGGLGWREKAGVSPADHLQLGSFSGMGVSGAWLRGHLGNFQNTNTLLYLRETDLHALGWVSGRCVSQNAPDGSNV